MVVRVLETEARAIEEIPPEELDNLLCHFFIKDWNLKTKVIIVNISVDLIIKNFLVFHLCFPHM